MNATKSYMAKQRANSGNHADVEDNTLETRKIVWRDRNEEQKRSKSKDVLK